MPVHHYAPLALAVTTAIAQAHAVPAEAVRVELDPIVVDAQGLQSFSHQSGGKLRDVVDVGMLGKEDAFSIPLSVINFDRQVIADQEPRTVVDMVSKKDASVMAFGGESNTLQGVYVRGLQLDARQFSLNGLSGIYSNYSSPTVAADSVQLIKGASTATVGMDAEGSAGAAINITTKRAGDEPLNEISTAWFSNNRIQPGFDVGRRFGDQQQWGVRVNGKYREGDTARRHYDEQNQEVAIGLDYRGEKLTLGLDVLHNERETHGGRARVQDMQQLKFQMPDAPDGKINLSPGWSGQTTKDQTVAFTFDYDTQNHLKISGGIGHMESRYYGSFGQARMSDANGDYRFQSLRGMDYHTRTTSANVKLRGDFKTGAVTHDWSASADYVKRQRDFDQGDTLTIDNLNIYNPQFGAPQPFGNLKQSTDNAFTAPSLAVADTMHLFDDRLRVTLGARLQYVQQENRNSGDKSTTHALSPVVGVAWMPQNDLTLYGNYMRDLEPGASVDSDYANGGTILRPAKTEQYEVGVRKDWADGLLTTTAALYQIRRPGTGVDEHNYFGYNGEERNSGLELNAYANLMEQTLRPMVSFSFSRAELNNYTLANGKRVDGKQQVTSPRFIAKAGVEWDTPFATGLTLNAHLQHYGKSYQNAENTYTLPGYTTVDLGAKYQSKVAGKDFILRGAVENVFNENYWQIQRGRYDRSFAVVGLPRTFWLKATLKL